MKKIFVQTLTVLYLVVSLFSPIFAKDFCEHKLEIISMENVIYDNDTYRKIVYSVDDEKMMVYINDKELLVYDEANNLVGYQDMKMTINNELYNNTYEKIIDKEIINKYLKLNELLSAKGGPPTMYNDWTSWSSVSNTTFVWNLSNFYNIGALAVAIYTAVSNNVPTTQYITWWRIADAWKDFLGQAVTKTSTLYRKTNTSCNIVIKESGYWTNTLRDTYYEVVWLENPWVYDIYPYACRYLWDKDL